MTNELAAFIFEDHARGHKPRHHPDELISICDRMLANARVRSSNLSPLTAYYSGSLAEGLGNAGSDLDLYVLIDTRQRPPTQNYLDPTSGLRVDIECWTLERIQEISDQIRSMRLGEDRLLGQLSRGDERFIHRLHVGVPILQADKFRLVQGFIPKPLFVRYLIARNVALVHEVAEDLWGCLDSADEVSLLIRSRDLVVHAFDAFACSRFETNPSPKWRGRIALNLVENGAMSQSMLQIVAPYILGLQDHRSVISDTQRYAERSFEIAGRFIFSAENFRDLDDKNIQAQ